MNAAVWSAIISAIALIAAVTSPILTAIINNHYQLKENNRKFYIEHKAEVIENYIRYVGGLNKGTRCTDDFRDYGKYSKEIYLYIPEDLWHLIDLIDEYYMKSDYDSASITLAELCKKLNEYHPRPIKKNRCNKNK